MREKDNHSDHHKGNRWLIFWTAVGALAASGALIYTSVSSASRNEPVSTPSAPITSQNDTTTTASSEPPPDTSPVADPANNGWEPGPMELLLTGDPIALSDDLNDPPDIGYDFSTQSISAHNDAFILDGIEPDPDNPPSAAVCRYAAEHGERYSGLPGWNLRGYLCMVTSRGNLVLVLPEGSTNGITFRVWAAPV